MGTRESRFFGAITIRRIYILEVAGEYSRWVEIEIVRPTSAGATIPKLDKIFSTLGIPYKITTDNGPPFHGKEITLFANYLNMKHAKITPYWPQANSTAENFNRCLRKTVQTAKVEHKNWKQEIYRFIRNYKATPHPSTEKSPAQLMFPGRSYRTRLPEPKRAYDDEEVRKTDETSKTKMKLLADNNRNARISTFSLGDTVLVKQKKLNKLSPPFNPSPHTIVQMKGSMITAKMNGTNTWVTRNS